MGTGDSFPGVKRPRREAEQSAAFTANPPLSHMSSWRGIQLIKHRENFTFKTVYKILHKCILD
jgi:hypothetical protein